MSEVYQPEIFRMAEITPELVLYIQKKLEESGATYDSIARDANEVASEIENYHKNHDFDLPLSDGSDTDEFEKHRQEHIRRYRASYLIQDMRRYRGSTPVSWEENRIFERASAHRRINAVCSQLTGLEEKIDNLVKIIDKNSNQ